MQNQAIQVEGLQKSYKKLHVLKGVDFEVEKGSIFALLGSNGAGKTTIVKILTTLLKQDSGTITVNGFDVASKPDNVRQSISLTGQFAAVDEILTGRENLIMIAKLRHLKNPCQVADDLLKRFGLTEAAVVLDPALSERIGDRPPTRPRKAEVRRDREYVPVCDPQVLAILEKFQELGLKTRTTSLDARY